MRDNGGYGVKCAISPCFRAFACVITCACYACAWCTRLGAFSRACARSGVCASGRVPVRVCVVYFLFFNCLITVC